MRIGYLKEVGSQTTVEISRGAFITGVASTGVVTAIISILTFLFIEAPKSRSDRQTAHATSQVSLLRESLSLEKANDRAQTLRMLLRTGMLKDPGGNLARLSNFPDSLPQWPKQQSVPNSNTFPAPQPVPPSPASPPSGISP